MINRKAQGYANPDLVNHLYEDYRRVKYDVDQLRKKRNEHAAALKNVMLIEDDSKREKLIESHHKVGKSFKNDMLAREKEIEVIDELVAIEIRESTVCECWPFDRMRRTKTAVSIDVILRNALGEFCEFGVQRVGEVAEVGAHHERIAVGFGQFARLRSVARTEWSLDEHVLTDHHAVW